MLYTCIPVTYTCSSFEPHCEKKTFRLNLDNKETDLSRHYMWADNVRNFNYMYSNYHTTKIEQDKFDEFISPDEGLFERNM